MSQENLEALLREAYTNDELLPRRIRAFRELVYDSELSDFEDEVKGILRELAYDLEYYVEDPSRRIEDPAYFGEDRARELIHEGLERLKAFR